MPSTRSQRAPDGELIRLNPNPQVGAKLAALYTAWMLVGFNRVHPIAGMPGKIVKAPYTRTIEGLFDGRHPGLPGLAALRLERRGHRPDRPLVPFA